MEAPESSPPCAHLGLLLLLLVGLGCSHLPEVQGKPVDFWCKVQHRIDMRNRTVNREEITVRRMNCVLIRVVRVTTPECVCWFKVSHLFACVTKLCSCAQAACVDSDTLPAPIQLPCVSIRVAAWANKTVSLTSSTFSFLVVKRLLRRLTLKHAQAKLQVTQEMFGSFTKTQ